MPRQAGLSERAVRVQASPLRSSNFRYSGKIPNLPISFRASASPTKSNAQSRKSTTAFQSLPSHLSPVSLFSSDGVPTPAIERAFSIASKENRTLVLGCVAHLRSKLHPLSVDERIFLHLVWGLSLSTAAQLAAISGLRCQRPLQALLAMTNEPARNCNEQNARRKAGRQNGSKRLAE